jgi:hypothetical protein
VARIGRHVSGLEALKKAFKAKLDKHKAGFRRGVKKATFLVHRESALLVPVDEGNLRASEFSRVEGQGFDSVGYVGYTADYAIYVHEDLELRHGEDYNAWHGEEIAAGLLKPRGPGQQAKFLEQPFRQNRQRIVNLIKEEMRKDGGTE